MLNTIRRWHWLLLHHVFGLPERQHGGSHAPLSTILHSHPPVPAHHRRVAGRNQQSLRSQLDRELRRHPRILPEWQRRIGAFFARLLAHEGGKRA